MIFIRLVAKTILKDIKTILKKTDFSPFLFENRTEVARFAALFDFDFSTSLSRNRSIGNKICRIIGSKRRAVVRVRIRHNVGGRQARTPDKRPSVRETNDKRNKY